MSRLGCIIHAGRGGFFPKKIHFSVSAEPVGGLAHGRLPVESPRASVLFRDQQTWAGQSLVDDAPLERLMRESRTPIGLTVSGSLDARNDPAEIKLLPERRKQIRSHRPSVLPPGNGTLLTRPSRNQFLPAARANRGPNLEKSSHFFEVAARGGANRNRLK